MISWISRSSSDEMSSMMIGIALVEMLVSDVCYVSLSSKNHFILPSEIIPSPSSSSSAISEEDPWCLAQCPLLKSLLAPASDDEALSSFSRINELLLGPLLPLLPVPLDDDPTDRTSWKLEPLSSCLLGEFDFSLWTRFGPRFFRMWSLIWQIWTLHLGLLGTGASIWTAPLLFELSFPKTLDFSVISVAIAVSNRAFFSFFTDVLKSLSALLLVVNVARGFTLPSTLASLSISYSIFISYC